MLDSQTTTTNGWLPTKNVRIVGDALQELIPNWSAHAPPPDVILRRPRDPALTNRLRQGRHKRLGGGGRWQTESGRAVGRDPPCHQSGHFMDVVLDRPLHGIRIAG